MEKITERLSTDYKVYQMFAERFFYLDGIPKLRIYYSGLRERTAYCVVDENADYVCEISESEFNCRLSEMKAS